ncbi:sugar phosphate isomerase/epimerase family protein [Streptomyces sp. NPDC056390]|uniref:sugar phosphate isomerase/epimerase family protein n=1 Tax=Streptomyces sp. NPDC056390 TaxID=3345806 RepID=UPI0035E0E767
MTTTMQLALNPIQWMATDDGWLDPALAPEPGALLALVRKAGFDAVMAALPDGVRPAQYAELVAGAGLGLAPGYFVCRSEGDPADADELLARAVAAAREHAELGLTDIGLGLAMIKGGPRILRPAQGTEPDPQRLAALTDLIGRIGEAMRAEGVRPSLHPHVGTWIETEEETRAVLDALPADLVGFLPDTGHLSWARANVAELVADYADRIPFLHVKDYRPEVAAQGRAEGWGYQKTVMEGLWVEPGRGALDLRDIVGRLPDGFAGHLMVEVDRPDIADPYESAVASATGMRSLFSFGA